MYFVAFCTFILYGIVIYNITLQHNQFFRKRNLVIIVFAISILEVILFQLLSYYIDGDTFVFSKADAMRYYNDGMRMSQMSLINSYHYITDIQGYGTDDLGAFLWISTMFRIVPSQQFLNMSYCIIGTVSALMLFDIGRNFMPRRYAFMAALCFSSASFIITHSAQCLKETIMACIIIIPFNLFITYIRKRNNKYLWLTILSSMLIFLFRVPTALLLLFSFGLTWALLHLTSKTAILLSGVFIIGISFTPVFSYSYDRYLKGGNTEAIIERKNELAGNGGIVNQLADPVAAMVGPFPSVRIKTIKPTILYASGLLYRFLLSVPFFLGAYFIFKKRYIEMYPFVIFFVINAIGVSISVKGLETRLSIPHLAMVYIVAFWFLAKYDYEQISWRISSKLSYGYFIAVFALCLLWNLR